MRKLHFIATACFAAILAACDGSDPTRSRVSPVPRSNDVVDCPFDGPVPDGCPLTYSDAYAEQPFATPIGVATGTERLWTGQDVDPNSGSLECPSSLLDPLFTIDVGEYGRVEFAAVGTFDLIQLLPPSPAGFPRGRYRVSPGPHYSAHPLGTYEASGGTIDATCIVQRFRTGTGVALLLGKMIYSNYTGQITRNPPGGGGSSWDERGWVSTIDGSTTGQSTPNGVNSPQMVIARLINTGQCTAGWEVWLDGDIVCNADGTHT